MGFLRALLAQIGIGKVSYELDMAQSELDSGLSERALTRCESLEQSFAHRLLLSDKIKLILIKARALANLGRIEGAKTCYYEILHHKPEDLIILGELALLYATEEDLRILDQHGGIAPESAPEELRKLCSYLYFKVGVGLIRTNAEIYARQAAKAFQMAKAFDPNNCIYMLAEAIVYCHSGNYAAAEKCIDAASQTSATEAVCKHLKGYLLAKRGKLEAAKRAFSDALLRDGSNPELFWNLAMIELVQGQINRAKKSMRQFQRIAGIEHPYQSKAVALVTALETVETVDFTPLLNKLRNPSHPGFSQFLRAFWFTCLRLICEGKVKEVELALGKLLGKVQLQTSTNHQLKLIYRELQNTYVYCLAFLDKWSEAEGVLGKMDNNSLPLAHNRAIVALRTKSPTDAASIWEKLIKQWESEYAQDSSDINRYRLIEAYLFLIDLLTEAQQWDKVIEVCNKVLKLDKGNAQALVYKRDALMAQKRYNEALRVSEHLMRIDPEEMAHKFSHTYVVAAAKDIDAALDWLIELKKKYPNEAPERFNEFAREICNSILKAHSDWIDAANKLLGEIAHIIVQRLLDWRIGVNWEAVERVRNELVSAAKKMRQHVRKAKQVVTNQDLLSAMQMMEEDIIRKIQELDEKLANLRKF
ncbi:MAG: hypothetical protein QXQ02_09790 [Halobacteria archaeon]